MSNDKREKQKSENSKTKRITNSKWAIDFNNTSDIGYPDIEYYTPIEKED